MKNIRQNSHTWGIAESDTTERLNTHVEEKVRRQEYHVEEHCPALAETRGRRMMGGSIIRAEVGGPVLSVSTFLPPLPWWCFLPSSFCSFISARAVTMLFLPPGFLFHVYVCVQSLSHVWLFAIPGTPAISSFGGSSPPRDQTRISCISCIGLRIFFILLHQLESPFSSIVQLKKSLIPVYLTYMQSTSCKMPGQMKHKLESRLPGEISITSDMQMTPPLWQKAKRN